MAVARTGAAILVAVLLPALCIALAMLVMRDLESPVAQLQWLFRGALLMSVGAVIGVFIARRICDRLFPGYSRWAVILVLLLHAATGPYAVGFGPADHNLLTTALQYAPSLSVALASILFFWPPCTRLAVNHGGRG